MTKPRRKWVIIELKTSLISKPKKMIDMQILCKNKFASKCSSKDGIIPYISL